VDEYGRSNIIRGQVMLVEVASGTKSPRIALILLIEAKY
jgi:hypothetical protein